VVESEIELRQIGPAGRGEDVVVDPEAGGVHGASWLEDPGCLTEGVVELIGEHVGEDRLGEEHVDRSVFGWEAHLRRDAAHQTDCEGCR